MKATCLINNFNYGKFVIEAVNSALNQSVSFDEIIVVDDCSTDESVQLLKENFLDNPKVKLSLKDKNEGQLSAFNVGFLASTGDIICFLDADDVYQPNYLEEALRFYQTHPECEFLLSGYEQFDKVEGIFLQYPYDRDLGYAVVSTLYARKYIRAITSTISVRKKILDKVLPLPFLDDWRRRADDCLFWGSAIAGARMFYMAKPLIRYRIHGNNYMMTAPLNSCVVYKRFSAISNMFEFLRQRLFYSSNLIDLAPLEFRTIPNPTREEFNIYSGIILSSPLPLHKKLGKIRYMFTHFQQSKKSDKM